MSPSRFLFNSSTLVLFISIITHYSAKAEEAGNNYGDGSTVPSPPTACNNCTICQYPCHPQPPPPPSGYQSYAAPPPPSVGQVNCPPAGPVICCGGGQYYAPPTPFYSPYNNYSGAAELSALIKRSLYVSTWPFTVLLFHCIMFCY